MNMNMSKCINNGMNNSMNNSLNGGMNNSMNGGLNNSMNSGMNNSMNNGGMANYNNNIMYNNQQVQNMMIKRQNFVSEQNRPAQNLKPRKKSQVIIQKDSHEYEIDLMKVFV